MKCELCHKADAEMAIVREGGDADEELYVCKACAASERRRRQKKSQRTRKVTGLPPGMEMSVTEISGGEDDEDGSHPILAAFMSAMDDFVSDIEKAGREKTGAKGVSKAPKMHDFPSARVESRFRYVGRLHLEGLHLIGELEAVQRALRALRFELVGVDADGVRSAGHAYTVRYPGSGEQAKRVVGAVLHAEFNARERLRGELRRVFGDALCRSLAILKNCRLLSSGELFDLLSPMRLGALDGLFDGLALDAVERLAGDLDLTSAEDKYEPEERDRADAERADEMNRLFEDVVLNERAEGEYLQS